MQQHSQWRDRSSFKLAAASRLGAASDSEAPPLHRAAYEGKAAAAEALLAAGADAKATNKNGKTAFEMARMDAKYLKARA